ncbi:MAG TPA: mechanosensitive ion channel family protein [Bryobacteraceae bacterium]|nr:mechanosensitive ion channel family protein [Bryobacteraceae bacterium]
MPTRSQLLNPDFYAPMLFNAVRIGLILLFAYLCTLAVGRLLRALRVYIVKMMERAGGAPEYELEKRARTIGGLTRKALFALIWVIAGLMILKEMNFDVRPLLAGAGLVGVAIGFGAQSIVKDVLGGLFLMMENQVRVNDIAVINGKGGLVEEINLRTIVLRDEDGSVHIFANGSIQSLSNLTREFSFYVFALSVSYKDDPDEAVAVLKQIGEQLAGEEPYHSVILAPLEIMGVDRLADSGVVIKARFKTLPGRQWLVGREMNRRIKKRFDEAHLEIGAAPQPVYLLPEISPQLRNELKQVIREVLAESSKG